MPDILTLTMNPALDVSTSIDRVMPTHKLRCEAAQTHPGGGGINVARVLHRLGTDCLAIFPAGGVTGQALQRLLDEEQVPARCIAMAQETRESFSVHENSTGLDWRFVLPGPTLAEDTWQGCLQAVAEALADARYLVVSGSLPPGVPADFYGQVADLARARGCRLVLDTSGPALSAALARGVYLVKPSLRELRDLTGQALVTPAEWLVAARQIIGQGQAQVVALSLGEQGALLVTAEAAWRAQSLSVPVASTIGAGDSFVGGLVHSLARGDDLVQALRHAMAAGAAALEGAGTTLCQAGDVFRLAHQVVITPM